jgi:DNA-binding NarL/FixJ family response regulator
MPRVLIADDHKIVVEGLKKLLSPEFEIAGAVEDGRELVKAAEKLRPDCSSARPSSTARKPGYGCTPIASG